MSWFRATPTDDQPVRVRRPKSVASVEGWDDAADQVADLPGPRARQFILGGLAVRVEDATPLSMPRPRCAAGWTALDAAT